MKISERWKTLFIGLFFTVIVWHIFKSNEISQEDITFGIFFALIGLGAILKSLFFWKSYQE